jgi:hypothetical protein
MLVEFAGVPGSGKTYVCTTVREWLKRHKIPFVDVDEFIRERAAKKSEKIPTLGPTDRKLDLGHKSTDVFLRSYMSFYRRHHKYVNSYCDCLFSRENDDRVIKSVLSTFMYGCARYAYCVDGNGAGDNGLTIQEEGFSHRLITLFGYDASDADADADIQAVAALTPLPQLVFWPQCSPATAYERMTSRTGKGLPDRMARSSPEEVMKMLATGQRRLKVGLEVLEKRGSEIAPILTGDDFREDVFFNYLKLKFLQGR